MMAHRLVFAGLACAAAACARSTKTQREFEDAASSRGFEEPVALSSERSASAPPRPPVPSDKASSPDPSSPPIAPVPSLNAPTSSCRALRGPIELPIRAPAALLSRAGAMVAVLNDAGRPRVVSFVAGPLATTPAYAAPAREPAERATPTVPRVPCALVGEIAMCPDRTGDVHRTRLTGEGSRTVASSRAGTRVAAASLAGAHIALAYLASRKTSEGWVSEAWLAVDDDPPVRLSEDGSGATAVDLAPRGPSILALSVDARTALTAMHARPVVYEHGARLGEDVVVFVGGPGDRRTAAALAMPSAGPAWGLLPIAKDTTDFGLVVVRLDDPPRVDEPAVWSMYPNGLDPSPVAAAVAEGRTWVARIRPQDAAPVAPRVLEVGDLSLDGAFTPRVRVASSDAPSDVGLAADGNGALWIAWLDTSGSWVERLACR